MIIKHDPPLPGNSIAELRKLEEQGRLQADHMIVAATDEQAGETYYYLGAAPGKLGFYEHIPALGYSENIPPFQYTLSKDVTVSDPEYGPIDSVRVALSDVRKFCDEPSLNLQKQRIEKKIGVLSKLVSVGFRYLRHAPQNEASLAFDKKLYTIPGEGERSFHWLNNPHGFAFYPYIPLKASAEDDATTVKLIFLPEEGTGKPGWENETYKVDKSFEDCIDKLGVDLLEAVEELHENLVLNAKKGDASSDANDRAIPESPETLLLESSKQTQHKVILQDWIRQSVARQKAR